MVWKWLALQKISEISAADNYLVYCRIYKVFMSLDSKVTASSQMSFQSDHGTDTSKCKYTLRKPH